MDTFAVRALLLAGLTVADVAARLHYQPKSIARVRLRLRKAGVLLPPVRPRDLAPYVPPDLDADARDRSLTQGRALAAAKVAAGEWALPRGGRP